MSKEVKFNPTTVDSQQRSDPYPKTMTSSAGINPNTGLVNGNPYKVPSGSQNADGRFTGDFRGLGVNNPWGGNKRKNMRKKSQRNKKTRRNR